MDVRFTAMEHDVCASTANGGSAAATPSVAARMFFFLPPWDSSSSSSLPLPSAPSAALAMRPCEALTSAGAWGYALVGQCFSRMHRSQFDEEHQRSLLSCHSTEDGESYSFPDEVMLELRRRVLKVDADPKQRKPTFAKDLDLAYPAQLPVYLPQSRNPTSRWEKRKANALAKKLQAAQAQENNGSNNRERSAPSSSSSSTTTNPKQFKTLLSDTEKALDDILSSQQHNHHQQQRQLFPHKPQAEDVRRLSVDELLALRPHSSSSLSTCSTSSGGSMSPDKLSSGPESEDGDDPSSSLPTEESQSQDAKLLRQWLADIDPVRADEYHAYARCFETQGFQALEDLAELDEHEVEQAMSEVGIAKFAHRARIRKAILRLRSDTFQSENSSILMNSN